MDKLEKYRHVVKEVLGKYAKTQYAHGDFHNEVVFDAENDRYLVVSLGWDGPKRVHGSLIHLDIKDGKVWIERDGIEDGIARDLEERGIPRSDIVLGFYQPDVRVHTGYAVA